MISPTTKNRLAPSVSIRQLHLSDGLKTTLHMARYRRKDVRLRILAFKQATYLIEWCEQNNVSEAINGGFFCRQTRRPLGEIFIEGRAFDYSAINQDWDKARGCLTINKDRLMITPRQNAGDYHSLLQAGPILLLGGKITAGLKKDTECFSAAASQFDSDITIGRYPRAAIGFDDKFIWSVVSDGYSVNDAGLSLIELAEFMQGLGVKNALNLDGGGSSTLISDGQLINRPRTTDYIYPAGRAIYSALIFEPSHNT